MQRASPDVIIRAATVEDASSIAQVQVDTWRSTYEGIIPASTLATLDVHKRTEAWSRIHSALNEKSHLIVATNPEGSVIGFASGGPQRSNDPTHNGEVYALYLLAAHQRRGIGSSLLRASFRSLSAAACTSVLVWVLEGNPARSFYERMGGRCIGEKLEDIGGAMHKQLAFGWDDILKSAISHGE